MGELFGAETSAWWFFGTLGPTHATSFNVQEVPVTDTCRLEVFHNRIGLWSKPGPSAIRSTEAVRELFALVVGAYTLVSGVPLDWSLDGWVEAKNAVVDGSTMGAVIDPRGRTTPPMLAPKDLPCRQMKAAASLAAAARGQVGYRLALRDIHSSLLLDQFSKSDDAFIFAYRALADVARAVSGRTGDIKPGDWDRLAGHLGIQPTTLKRRKEALEKARHAAAHGHEGDPDLTNARARRSELINVARLLVARTMSLEPTLKLSYRLVERHPTGLA
jgi:hypothetical protein